MMRQRMKRIKGKIRKTKVQAPKVQRPKEIILPAVKAAEEQRVKAQKLKLMFARIQYKKAKGLELDAEEADLLTEAQRQYYYKPKEQWFFDSDGLLHHRRTADVEPVFEALQAYRHLLTKNATGKRLVGSVDGITATQWALECGAKLYSEEWKEYAMKKLNSRDYCKFRMDWS